MKKVKITSIASNRYCSLAVAARFWLCSSYCALPISLCSPLPPPPPRPFWPAASRLFSNFSSVTGANIMANYVSLVAPVSDLTGQLVSDYCPSACRIRSSISRYCWAWAINSPLTNSDSCRSLIYVWRTITTNPLWRDLLREKLDTATKEKVHPLN